MESVERRDSEKDHAGREEDLKMINDLLWRLTNKAYITVGKAIEDKPYHLPFARHDEDSKNKWYFVVPGGPGMSQDWAAVSMVSFDTPNQAAAGLRNRIRQILDAKRIVEEGP